MVFRLFSCTELHGFIYMEEMYLFHTISTNIFLVISEIGVEINRNRCAVAVPCLNWYWGRKFIKAPILLLGWNLDACSFISIHVAKRWGFDSKTMEILRNMLRWDLHRVEQLMFMIGYQTTRFQFALHFFFFFLFCVFKNLIIH